MEALILSCCTGGGHDTAGHAVAEELKQRGHAVTFMDPYQLTGKNTAAHVGNSYIELVQKLPGLFGVIYNLGEAYRRFPLRSPVYWMNGKMANSMKTFLEANHYDIIIASHIFPAQILASLKRQNVKIPKSIFITTDYTCIPLMEETECDFYVVPSPELIDDFCARGIPKDKLLPFGIPVRQEFLQTTTKKEAKASLGLCQYKRYLLLSGGSIGAGRLAEAVKILQKHLKTHKSCTLIVICGKNQKLFDELHHEYEQDKQIHIIQSTSSMATYMKACEIFISKPGGLSSTEAAVSGTALLHISPIPGCETHNVHFFTKHGMSVFAENLEKSLLPSLQSLLSSGMTVQMKRNQETYINRYATSDLCDFIEKGWS